MSLEYMKARMDEAYKFCPFGSWFERWIPGVCKHDMVRCTHGDEIIGRNFKRRVCMRCGKALKGPLPDICFFTGKPHRSRLSEEG